jgi:hypothetical protein
MSDIVNPPLPVTWITVDDVAAAAGVKPAAVADDAWLATVTDAANAWAFRMRQASGYVDDPNVAPGPDAAAGTTLYGLALYRERGAVDGYAGFSELGTTAPTGGTLGQINRLLGIRKPVVA